MWNYGKIFFMALIFLQIGIGGNINTVITDENIIHVYFPTILTDLSIYVVNDTTNETLYEVDKSKIVIKKMGVLYPIEYIGFLSDYDIVINEPIDPTILSYKIEYSYMYVHTLAYALFILLPTIIAFATRSPSAGGVSGLLTIYIVFGLYPLGWTLFYVAQSLTLITYTLLK